MDWRCACGLKEKDGGKGRGKRMRECGLKVKGEREYGLKEKDEGKGWERKREE